MFDKTTITADILKEYVLNKPKKTFSGISPSSLGGCMRSHFYKLKGIAPTTPPGWSTLLNFEVGRVWEAKVAEAYKDQGRLVKWFQDGVDEPWWVDEYNLTGTPDILATKSVDDPELIIVDVKTMASKWFLYAKRYKTFQEFCADNKSYIYQQVCYILLARANGYPKMRTAVLSFCSKDNGMVGLEIEITLTTELVKMVTDRLLELKGYIDRDELPPCECEGWKCGYCDYGDPNTREENKTHKMVNTSCCSEKLFNDFKEGLNDSEGHK